MTKYSCCSLAPHLSQGASLCHLQLILIDWHQIGHTFWIRKICIDKFGSDGANTKETRNGYQSFVFINGLPNAGVLVIDANSDPAFPIDNIQPEFLMWHIWGTCSKPPSALNAGDADFFSFSNQGDSRISFTMTDLVLTVTTTVDLTQYYCFIVCEFIRAGTNGI